MLVLSRKVGEEIVLPGCGVTIGVVGVRGSKVRLGVTAPPEVHVRRQELALSDSGPPSDSRRRADHEWQRAIHRKIVERTHGRVSDIEVELDDGRLIVRGRSKTYYGKQLACAAALEILDTLEPERARQVELDVEVARGPTGDEP